LIDLLMLGTGAMTPLPDRWLSSLLVRCRGELTLFDCGEGTQIPWRTYGWGFRRVGAICFSHCHADHIAGLPGLLHSLANSGRTEQVMCYGPPRIAKVIDGLRAIARDLPFPVTVTELDGGERFSLPGGLHGVAMPVDHRIPCLAYRVGVDRARRFDPERARALGVPLDLWRELQRGRPATWSDGAATPDDVLGPPRPGLSFGFVTDTRPTEALPGFLTGVDLLVCEGTYGDSADAHKAVAHKHMTFAEAAGIAHAAGAQALLLTHFSPAMANPAEYLPNATTIFPETNIATSGYTRTLNFADE
jgi:ribonuclease Z